MISQMAKKRRNPTQMFPADFLNGRAGSRRSAGAGTVATVRRYGIGRSLPGSFVDIRVG
jgi:hypothetical protein